MASIYDEVDREARADRRNADIPREKPDPSEYADLGTLNPRQFYEPPRDDIPPYDPATDPF